LILTIRLSGFMVGRDALVARLYDKTAEIQKRGLGWLPDLWGTDGRDQAVWRLEFQYRRAALAEFNLKRVDDVVASVQDLWRYATEVWLSLRLPTRHSQSESVPTVERNGEPRLAGRRLSASGER